MYNKIFTKILDSSIWLEDEHTRIVWFTLLASMDEEGFACYASIKNLSHRARVPEEQTSNAVKILEAADPHSSDPDNEGRRIEKVPGGWIVLNAPKYRDIVTREEIKKKTRERVARHRAVTNVTKCNVDPVTCNAPVTQSDTDTGSYTKAEEKREPISPKRILTDLWCSRFKAILNAPYKFNGVIDGRGADELLKLGMSPDEIMSIAEKAWISKEWWCSKHSKTMASFASKFNQIRDEVGELKAETKKQSLKDDPFWKQ